MDIIQGENDYIELFLTEREEGEDVPIDLTGTTILVTIKKDIQIENDDKAVFKKDITQHEDQETKKGKSVITFSRQETSNIPVGKYWIDMWLIKGGEYTQIYPADDSFEVKPRVTRRNA